MVGGIDVALMTPVHTVKKAVTRSKSVDLYLSESRAGWVSGQNGQWVERQLEKTHDETVTYF